MYLGIDIGSVSINAVMIDNNKSVICYRTDQSGYDHMDAVEKMIELICHEVCADRSAIKKIISTGYGRRNVPGAYKSVTEITCHAVGIRHLFPEAEVVIDIGGQDSKAIQLSNKGLVESFVMNDKCSAGTGRFLEVMAGVMKMDMEQFSECGLVSEKPYKISSVCTVFAESEVVSGIAKGVPKEDLTAGIFASIAARCLSMTHNMDTRKETILTGGVAKNKGIAKYIMKKIPGLKIPPEPQITGALGAALIGRAEDL
ncbi:MAG: acyl-CoA dehydratase activase [Defluviitaleaceae bacterium]|nr:acyl-CoA dehydratase activase [Defluviitaleaceae bacterium]